MWRSPARWWWRIVVTLVLAPVLWQLAAIYLGSSIGSGSIEALVTASFASLPGIYLIYTLPALALVALVLLPADRLLALLGGDLLIVIVAPILALVVPIVLSLLIRDPRLDVAAIPYLAFAYGLVFGLTVREPRWPAGAASATTDGQDVRA